MVHEEVLERLAEARTAYLRHDYTSAERFDQEALGVARTSACRAGEARALRYLGLCAYRLGRAAESVVLLGDSLGVVRELGWISEELLVSNHLGASLRKVGDLQRAHDVLAFALERALGPPFLMERARLLGSMGALYDDLGDLDAAADCYARYQELLWLTPDLARQANAAGLVSRVQRLRGRTEEALQSARLERALGHQAQDTVRISRGALHEAQVLTSLGRHDEAKAALDEAQDRMAAGGDPRDMVRLAGARAGAALARGDIVEADARIHQGWTVLRDAGLDREREMTARLAETSAEVSSAAGLHGEALWHLGNALEAHLIRFDSISSQPMRELTAGRRRSLCELASRLVAEECSVGRADDEIERVRSLVGRLSEYDEPSPELEPKQPDVQRWRRDLEETSEARWRAMLGTGIEQLGAGTRVDLVLADVLGHGPVGDLPRSLFLLMTAVERELFQRVFEPVKSKMPYGAFSDRVRPLFRGDGRPPTVGEMWHFLVDKPNPEFSKILAGGALDRLRTLANQLGTSPTTLDGGVALSPMKLRNAIAHGREYSLSRLEADSIRRALSLGADAPLRILGEAEFVQV